MKKLFLVGGGGHCHSCIDVIELENKFKIQGIFDLSEKIGQKVLNYTVIGSDQNFIDYIKPDHYFLITVGQIKTASIREKLYLNLKSLNASFATVVSPRAYLSPHCSVGEGSIVLHDALVNANAKIGVNCIINTKSLIEHDAVVGNHCHIATAAIVNGDCFVHDGSFIGSNSVLREGVVVAKESVIPAGVFINGK